MSDVEELVASLEGYLTQLNSALDAWEGWLARTQQAIVAGDTLRLQTIESDAQEYLRSLAECIERRTDWLADASRRGLSATTVRGAVRSLGRRVPRSLGDVVRHAELRLERLRRLHAAVWVLANQLFHHSTGTLRLITSGAIEKAAYNQPEDSEVLSGLLDECA
ncbi:MAG: hypothetical protein KatS3mg111_1421 [Pirellulaceae bacterium]|nr:MAG: hypothetical protein KatS3mg111_1421 [Pirellulaceae bacterium]